MPAQTSFTFAFMYIKADSAYKDNKKSFVIVLTVMVLLEKYSSNIVYASGGVVSPLMYNNVALAKQHLGEEPDEDI